MHKNVCQRTQAHVQRLQPDADAADNHMRIIYRMSWLRVHEQAFLYPAMDQRAQEKKDHQSYRQCKCTKQICRPPAIFGRGWYVCMNGVHTQHSDPRP